MNFEIARQLMDSFADKSDCATDMFGKISRTELIVKELLRNAVKCGLEPDEINQFKEDLCIIETRNVKLPENGLFYGAQMAILKGVSEYVDEMLDEPEFRELYDARLNAEIRFMESVY